MTPAHSSKLWRVIPPLVLRGNPNIRGIRRVSLQQRPSQYGRSPNQSALNKITTGNGPVFTWTLLHARNLTAVPLEQARAVSINTEESLARRSASVQRLAGADMLTAATGAPSSPNTGAAMVMSPR
jgi:hypothetical protein